MNKYITLLLLFSAGVLSGQIITSVTPTNLSYKIKRDSRLMEVLLGNHSNTLNISWTISTSESYNFSLIDNSDLSIWKGEVWTLDYLGGDAANVSSLCWGGQSLFSNYQLGVNSSRQIVFNSDATNQLLNLNNDVGSIGYYADPLRFRIYQNSDQRTYILAIEDLGGWQNRDWNDGLFLLTKSVIPEPSLIILLTGLFGFVLMGRKQ